MRILYLDCFSGISGDMLLGALLDLGLDLEVLSERLSVLGVAGYRLERRADRDGALAGTRFLVHLEETGHGDAHDTARHKAHGAGQSHAHEAGTCEEEEAGASHDHEFGPAPRRHDHGHRSFGDIKALISDCALSGEVKTTALAIFQRLAEAEARVHGISVDSVAFHEVGALDSIVDIVGVAIALAELRIDEVRCAPLPLGQGFVECQHGRLPLPAPATLELLRGLPVYDAGVRRELVTPTGAAIVAALSSGFGGLPAMTVDGIGYGLGSRRGEATPNALRAVLGRSDAEGRRLGRLRFEKAVVVEANVDDMNPQFYEHLMERLFGAGALDVGLVAMQMKKGRPGVCVQVICVEEIRERILATLLSETTSIGARFYPVERACLERRTHGIATDFGVINVKTAGDGEEVWNVMPEFEDCREAAVRCSVPLKVVHQEAVRRARERFARGAGESDLNGDDFPHDESSDQLQ